MKLTIPHSHFFKAIKSIENIVPEPMSGNPIYGFIKISAKEGMVTIESNTGVISTKYKIDCEVKDEGEILLPYDKVIRWLMLVPRDNDIKLSSTVSMCMTISSGSVKTKINGRSADDFPMDMFKGEPVNSFVVSRHDYKQAIRKCCTACTKRRFGILGDLYINLEEGKLNVTGLTRQAIAHQVMDVKENSSERIEFLIPGDLSSRVVDIFEEGCDDLTIEEYSSGIFYKSGRKHAFFPKSKDSPTLFPSRGKDLISKEYINEFEVDRKDLLRTIRRLMIFVENTTNQQIKFEFKKDSFTVSTPDTEAGSEVASFNVKNSGNPEDIYINCTFLISRLKSIEDDILRVKISDKYKPIVLLDGDSGSYHAVMPLKVR